MPCLAHACVRPRPGSLINVMGEGTRRYGQEEHLPSNGKCTRLHSLQLQNYGSHKKNKIVAIRRVSRLKIYPHCDCGHGSAPDPNGGSLHEAED